MPYPQEVSTAEIDPRCLLYMIMSTEKVLEFKTLKLWIDFVRHILFQWPKCAIYYKWDYKLTRCPHFQVPYVTVSAKTSLITQDRKLDFFFTHT